MKHIYTRAHIAVAFCFLSIPIFAAQTPDSAPVKSSSSKSITIGELIEQTQELAESLQGEDAKPANEAIPEIESILETVRQIDQTMQADPSHWTWKLIPRVPLEDEKDQEKFVIDPPLDNGSAIAFQCRKSKVRIQSIKVIDANGVSTVFTIEQAFDDDQKQKEIRYLYYPTPISTIIVSYATEKDARGRLNVWGGQTDLPEFAKEAIYWYMLSRNELRQGLAQSAAERLKQAAVKLYLFKLSRKIQ